MDHDDFSNVSWHSDRAAQNPEASIPDPGEAQDGGNVNGKRHGSDEPQTGHAADALDLAGLEGAVLECTVTSPIKENDGTKDAYVSYLVTTNVWLFIAYFKLILTRLLRLRFPPSRNQPLLFGDVLPTSFSCTRRFVKNTPPAPFLLCPISTKWNTFVVIGLEQILHSAGQIHFTAS